MTITICTALKFLSTLSLRRATLTLIIGFLGTVFLSTLSLRRATHYDNYNLHCVEISIHALLAESDLAGPSGPAFLFNFYPRSPCGERPYDGLIASANFCNFYPRSPCGERRHHSENCQARQEFLSTLSLRRATGS